MVNLTSMMKEYARKRGDEKYDFGSQTNCALCQFLRDKGFSKEPVVDGFYWKDDEGLWYPLPATLRGGLVKLPHTFSALADRLETPHA